MLKLSKILILIPSQSAYKIPALFENDILTIKDVFYNKNMVSF